MSKQWCRFMFFKNCMYEGCTYRHIEEWTQSEDETPAQSLMQKDTKTLIKGLEGAASALERKAWKSKKNDKDKDKDKDNAVTLTSIGKWMKDLGLGNGIGANRVHEVIVWLCESLHFDLMGANPLIKTILKKLLADLYPYITPPASPGGSPGLSPTADPVPDPKGPAAKASAPVATVACVTSAGAYCPYAEPTPAQADAELELSIEHDNGFPPVEFLCMYYM